MTSYIIGKTKRGLENEPQEEHLTKQQYFRLSELCMSFLADNNISELPVSLNKIVKNNNWKIIPYSRLRLVNIKSYQLVMERNLGFAELRQGHYFIYYDDEKSIEVQRFTIAHEIGHVVLNHFREFSNCREKEANMFAARLLMPMCVLHECRVNSSEEIAKLCKVSQTAAAFRNERLQMLKNRNKFYKNEKEKLVYKNFKTFIDTTLIKKQFP